MVFSTQRNSTMSLSRVQLSKWRYLENQFVNVFFSTAEAQNWTQCFRYTLTSTERRWIVTSTCWSSVVGNQPSLLPGLTAGSHSTSGSLGTPRVIATELLFSQLMGPQPGLLQGLIPFPTAGLCICLCHRHLAVLLFAACLKTEQ